MPKQLKFELTEAELKLVETAMQTDQRAIVRQRATALRLLHLDYAVAEVASILAVTSATVYGWVRRWHEGGLGGLANRPKAMKRRKVTESYQQALERALAQPPLTFGYAFAVWTLERMRDHLARETGIHVSIVWLRKLMTEAGYVYRRPKHDLTHLQDPIAKQQATAWLETLKKGRNPVLTDFSLWTKHP